jgi:LytS/YehU family sensor histidine kinase
MDFMLKRYRDDELFVTLASEIQFLRRFIVFQIAGDEKLVIRFNGERINGKVEEIALNSIDKKEWEKVKIPRLCLIEGVVNSIKYVDTTNKPTIEITCSLCEEKLDFVVINKVNSKNKEVKKKSSGSGLELTKNILSSAYIPSNFIAPDPLEILKGNNFIYRVIIEDVFDETKRINYHPKTEEK